MGYCNVCGTYDDHYDENSDALHSATPKHKCNIIIANYKENKSQFVKNKDGIFIFCNAESIKFKDAPVMKVEKCAQQKTRIYAKPKQKVKFTFEISSDLKNEDVLIVGIQLAHPQPQFVMNDHGYVFGGEPHILKRKSSISREVSVTFVADDICQYEMPIMFTFHKPSQNKNIIFVREMVVISQDATVNTEYVKSPFTKDELKKADEFIESPGSLPYERSYKIPKTLKTLLPLGLNEDALDKLRMATNAKNELREILISTRAIIEEGLTIDNYRMYFHYLLWWEEIITRINLRRYNMAGVTLLDGGDGTFYLEVPGLAEKRPSLLRGDRAFLRPEHNTTILFESIISNTKDNSVQLGKLDERFYSYYRPNVTFNVRFLMSRVPMERMHAAVDRVFTSGQGGRVFPQPQPVKKIPKLKPIAKFYNKLVQENAEQRSAVEHIVSKTCGTVPYIVFGPPGTGKTMTIVEAIVQIVVSNPRHRVLVCTDSNMAADHIAVMLLKYNAQLNVNKFLLRANSENREWSIMPPELVPVSNGSSRVTFSSLHNEYLNMFRVVVTTLLHAAKYGSDSNQSKCKLEMSHLFIDEAAQAKEPAALVPVSSLLAPRGLLVLAGDPQQLGPVCISKEAHSRGLGVSLLERLWRDYRNIYEDNPNYITTLVQNYRSDPDILEIPNQLFYTEKPLQPRAKLDPLSKTNILGAAGATDATDGSRAVVFHAVSSSEQRMGNAPSYYNEREMQVVQRYVRALVSRHQVQPRDIGIISPYIRQVYKVRDWLKNNSLDKVEVGTVESFQGKEKRAIVVSTVRGNCRLLDYDAKYNLGFLVDDKRFNVALTRAKAKLIIIGNPTCLVRDLKWRMYMDLCRDYGCYFGQELEQLERSSALLIEVARTRFDRCRLTDALEAALNEFETKKKNLHQ